MSAGDLPDLQKLRVDLTNRANLARIASVFRDLGRDVQDVEMATEDDEHAIERTRRLLKDANKRLRYIIR
ncbi:hypothetical protein [Devosia sp. Naph2]|uniref:hypothetical protein n=1 Tax=Devosia polycyclovorans TaxID=3345148 RepID=UPI0035D10140|tara:strand:+ start:555 stop:764 length:210 start_codon:yes stop_codon:yes gene_type:complete